MAVSLTYGASISNSFWASWTAATRRRLSFCFIRGDASIKRYIIIYSRSFPSYPCWRARQCLPLPSMTGALQFFYIPFIIHSPIGACDGVRSFLQGRNIIDTSFSFTPFFFILPLSKRADPKNGSARLRPFRIKTGWGSGVTWFSLWGPKAPKNSFRRRFPPGIARDRHIARCNSPRRSHIPDKWEATRRRFFGLSPA